MNIARSILCFVIAILLVSSVQQPEPDVITVEEAAKKGMIKFTIKGKGGYTGEVIQMKVKNLFAKRFKLKLPAGHRLDNKDSTQQDILVTKPEEIVLNAKEERTISVWGMCCQAHNGAPTEKSEFRPGKIADSLLIKIAEFIDANKLHKSYTAQNAVWVISDNNRMESISGSDKEEVKMVQEFVSKLTGRPIPKYTIDYEQEAGRAFSGKPKELKGSIAYYLNANALVTCGVYDQRGKIVELFFREKPQDPRQHVYEFTFHTSGIPKGTYYVKVFADGQLKAEEKVEL